MNKPQIGLVIPIVQRKYIISLIKQINKTVHDNNIVICVVNDGNNKIMSDPHSDLEKVMARQKIRRQYGGKVRTSKALPGGKVRRKYNGGITANVCRKPPKTIGFLAKSSGFRSQTLSELVHT